MTLRVLDLFSGIGGFSLGLRMTGGFENDHLVDLNKMIEAGKGAEREIADPMMKARKE